MHNELYKLLPQVKEVYKKGENMIQFLKNISGSNKNLAEAIQISYDFQSGSYIKYIKENFTKSDAYTSEIAGIINELGPFSSIMEAGVGEATTMGQILPKLSQKEKDVYGFDISWSRLKFGLEFLDSRQLNGRLFMGDLFSIPLKENSIDIVYTSHSIEPNGGKEKEVLSELYRVAKKYLVLIEPMYELGSDEAKLRMEFHGYVRGVREAAEQLGMNVIEHRLLNTLQSPLNPSGLLLIEKNSTVDSVENPFMCPNTETTLTEKDDCYFSQDSYLIYPKIGNIPCLLASNAILATKYEETAKNILI